MTFSVPPEHVLLNCRYSSKYEVIEAIGQVMVSAGDVDPAYAEAMQERERQYSTWVTEGVALPHGTDQVKKYVRRNCLVVVQLPAGIDWGDGRTVYVAIGFAGRGDREHIGLLAALAGVLQDAANVERLRFASSQQEVVRILSAGGREETTA